MAFYILLLKESENKEQVTYKFGPNENQAGLLRLDKITGLVEEIEPPPVNNSSAFFHRAGAKIHLCWKQGKFPEKTSWAS